MKRVIYQKNSYNSGAVPFPLKITLANLSIKLYRQTQTLQIPVVPELLNNFRQNLVLVRFHYHCHRFTFVLFLHLGSANGGSK